jgi:hypothetical protein
MNRRQFRQAYRNAKAGLRRANPELSNAEIRDAARRNFSAPVENMTRSIPMPSYLPESAINVTPQTSIGPMVQQLQDPSQMASQLSFNSAFGRARKLGLQQFSWRGKDYNTKLAETPAAPATQPVSLYSNPQARQIHADTIAQNQRIMEETGNRGGVANGIKAGILSTLNYPMK